MYFTDQSLHGLEHFIKLPKYPNQRVGGRYHNKYEYTKKDCNCHNCLYWQKYKGCNLTICPFIQERIDCGACSFEEIISVTFTDVYNKNLKKQVKQYAKESKTMDVKFRNQKHRELFYKVLENQNITNNAFVAAVYLMTADIILWKQVCLKINSEAILFDKIRLKKSSLESYPLFCAAQDLYLGTEHISISDLTDEEIIPKKALEIICNAIAIRRFGIGVLKCD